MSLKRRILSVLQIAVVISGFFAFTAGAGPYRPEMWTLANPSGAKSWKDYFRRLNDESLTMRAHEFHWVMQLLTRQETASKAILTLQAVRGDLSPEFRWLLAAVEIDHLLISKDTVEDARSAILNNLFIVPKTKSDLHDTETLIDKSLAYTIPGVKPDWRGRVVVRFMPMASLEDLVFLHSRWQKLPLFDTFPISPSDIENLKIKRLQWLEALTSVSNRISVAKIREIFDFMDNPKFLSLGSGAESATLVRIWQIVRNLRTKYAISIEDAQKVLYDEYPAPYKTDMAHILGLMKKWTYKNISFLTLNYRTLREARILTIEDLFAYHPNQNDIFELEQIIGSKTFNTTFLEEEKTGKTKADLDAYLIALVFWAHQNQKGREPGTDGSVDRATLDILLRTKGYRTGVSLADSHESRWMSATDFNFLVKTFYESCKRRILSPDVAIKLLNYKTLKTENSSEKDWQELEWLRLEAVEKALSPTQFKEELVKKVLGTTAESLYERLLAAKYLRLKMKVDDLDQIALRLKYHEEGVRKESYKGLSPNTWSKKEGELITVMAALQPADPDLRDYLSEIFVKKHLDGPLGPRDALGKLVEIGFGPDWLKEELIRRLKYVESGDSVGHFNALLSLFPNEGLAIAEVIFAHRRQIDKFKMLMFVLMEHAKHNPSLIYSIREGLKSSIHSDAKFALYQNLSLDKWLEQRVGTVSGSPMAANECTKELEKVSQTPIGEK